MDTSKIIIILKDKDMQLKVNNDSYQIKQVDQCIKSCK